MALVVNLSNYLVARSDLESDLVVARERAIKERKALLSSYLMLAKTAIEGSYGKPDSPEVRQQVKEILRPLRYGSDGYFFVYDYQGNTVLLPTRPEMEGKNRWQDKDTKGAFLIQGIIKSAREGDGFSEYWTNKPSIGRDAPSSPSIWCSTSISGSWARASTSTTSTMSWPPCAASGRRPCMAP